MGTRDPRIDAYIDNSADFAKPILDYLREVVHEGCPEAQETMKWSFPHFDYKGILCSMASFKQHCAFGFWKGSLIVGGDGGSGEDAMGQFGRITSVDDLPPRETLVGYVREAKRLNDEGVKSPTRSKPKEPRPEAEVPGDLAAALEENEQARATFERFSPSNRREYVDWITEAKSEATRQKRLAQAVEWMAEGKVRNWKYLKT
ncbi:MAG TPA: YdeI/OmpD-associated family protein [Longimicrobium sp.]|jgi:uncharacterized protein YdeI (YjbR/CyaY-like superfamily)